MPLQLGAGAHGAHFVGQQPLSDGTPVAQPASNKVPAAIAIKPFFIIHFPLYFKLKTNHQKVLKKLFTDTYHLESATCPEMVADLVSMSIAPHMGNLDLSGEEMQVKSDKKLQNFC